MGILRDFLRCVGETRLPPELARKIRQASTHTTLRTSWQRQARPDGRVDAKIDVDRFANVGRQPHCGVAEEVKAIFFTAISNLAISHV